MPGQTLQASYINNSTEQANVSGLSTTLRGDPNILVTRQLPNRLFAANYNGIIANKLFATAQYSEKKFGFRNTGGTSTAIIDSPFRSRGVTPGVAGNVFYNAPYFDSTDPEDRNNRQVAGSVSYNLSTKRMGSHDLKGGAERYTSTRTGGNARAAAEDRVARRALALAPLGCRRAAARDASAVGAVGRRIRRIG